MTDNLEMLRWVNLLTDFAFYCGTGYKTTMGMGQTRREGGIGVVWRLTAGLRDHLVH